MNSVCVCVCVCDRESSHHQVLEGSCSGRSAGYGTHWVAGTFCSSAKTQIKEITLGVNNTEKPSVHCVSTVVSINGFSVCACTG